MYSIDLLFEREQSNKNDFVILNNSNFIFTSEQIVNRYYLYSNTNLSE